MQGQTISHSLIRYPPTLPHSRLLYQAFVLDYCSVVWGSCSTTLRRWVESIQNYALRMIPKKPPCTNSQSLRQTMHWTTLETRRKSAILTQVHRCVLKQAPSYLCNKFECKSTLNCTCTRGQNTLHYVDPCRVLLNHFRIPGSQAIQ